MDLTAEFIKACESITQEQVDPLLEKGQNIEQLTESPFNPIFIEIWPFIK